MTDEAQSRLTAVEAMLEALPGHLASEELFRVVVVDHRDGSSKVTLTVGGLLDEIDALRGDPAVDAERLESVEERLQEIRTRHPHMYGKAVRQELRSAMNDWHAVVEDLEDDEEDAADAYPMAARNRTRAEQLLEEAEVHDIDPGGVPKALEDIDERMRRVTRPAPFIGADEDEDRFPQDEYWWLYAKPE